MRVVIRSIRHIPGNSNSYTEYTEHGFEIWYAHALVDIVNKRGGQKYPQWVAD